MKKENKEKIYKLVMLILLTAFITFMITSFWMYSYFNKSINISSEKESSENFSRERAFNVGIGNNNTSDLDKYLSRIKSTIEKYYLWKDDIDEEKLKTSAIEGYVAGLGDEYTEYIPKEEMDDFTEEISRKLYRNWNIYACG